MLHLVPHFSLGLRSGVKGGKKPLGCFMFQKLFPLTWQNCSLSHSCPTLVWFPSPPDCASLVKLELACSGTSRAGDVPPPGLGAESAPMPHCLASQLRVVPKG